MGFYTRVGSLVLATSGRGLRDSPGRRSLYAPVPLSGARLEGAGASGAGSRPVWQGAMLRTGLCDADCGLHSEKQEECVLAGQAALSRWCHQVTEPGSVWGGRRWDVLVARPWREGEGFL